MLHHVQKRYLLLATVLMLAVTTALPATAQIKVKPDEFNDLRKYQGKTIQFTGLMRVGASRIPKRSDFYHIDMMANNNYAFPYADFEISESLFQQLKQRKMLEILSGRTDTTKLFTVRLTMKVLKSGKAKKNVVRGKAVNVLQVLKVEYNGTDGSLQTVQ